MLHVETFPTVKPGGRLLIIGDIHGCLNEFNRLLESVKYNYQKDTVLLLGDLVNKGYDSIGVVRRAMELKAYCILGNHDVALLNYMAAPDLGNHEDPLWQLAQKFPADCAAYLKSLPYIYRIPQFNVIAVHAGVNPSLPLEHQSIWEVLHMRSIDPATGMCSEDLRGESWASLWKGPERIIFGHDARSGFQQHEFATGIDTGCCYGNALTAVVFPGGEYFQVKSQFKQSKASRQKQHEAKHAMMDASSPLLVETPASTTSSTATANNKKVSAFPASPSGSPNNAGSSGVGEANVADLLSKAMLMKNTPTSSTASAATTQGISVSSSGGGIDLGQFAKKLGTINNNNNNNSEDGFMTLNNNDNTNANAIQMPLPKNKYQQQQQLPNSSYTTSGTTSGEITPPTVDFSPASAHLLASMSDNNNVSNNTQNFTSLKQQQQSRYEEPKKRNTAAAAATSSSASNIAGSQGKTATCSRALAVRELCGSDLPRIQFENIVLQLLNANEDPDTVDAVVNDATIREGCWIDVCLGLANSSRLREGKKGNDIMILLQDILTARADVAKSLSKQTDVRTRLQSLTSESWLSECGLSAKVIKETIICI